MVTEKFPLLLLAYLAICAVIDHFDLMTIIDFSFCSKRSLRVAKQCWKKKKGLIKPELSVERNPRIILNYNEKPSYLFLVSKRQDLRSQNTEKLRIGDAVVTSILKRFETITYWDDKIFGIELFVSYIKDLFDVPIHSIVLKSEEYPNEFIRTIDWDMSQSVREWTLHCGESNDECLTHLLDNRRITENLRIYYGPSNQFRHHWSIYSDDLYVDNAKSFTLQNLININCKFLGLMRSNLTSEDLNLFLKYWKNGGKSRLKFLSIGINSMDRETVTSGIDTVSQPQGLQRRYEKMNNYTIEKCGGLDIRRNDGTTGTIFLNDYSFGFGVDPEVIRRPD